jgi:hypothetical protein
VQGVYLQGGRGTGDLVLSDRHAFDRPQAQTEKGEMVNFKAFLQSPQGDSFPRALQILGYAQESLPCS